MLCKKIRLSIALLAAVHFSFAQGGMPSQPFQAKCGENSHASGTLNVVHQVAINGSTDLAGCIRGNDDAYIRHIRLVKHGVTGFDYMIEAVGGGPDGFFNGSLYLRFFDATGDYYDLSLFRHEEDVHVVNFNSDDPTIKHILWNNESFKQDFCVECEVLVTKAITMALSDASGCAELGEYITGECDIAAGGPEDIIGDLVCVGVGYTATKLCDDVNFGWFKEHISEVAVRTCQDLHLCKK